MEKLQNEASFETFISYLRELNERGTLTFTQNSWETRIGSRRMEVKTSFIVTAEVKEIDKSDD